MSTFNELKELLSHLDEVDLGEVMFFWDDVSRHYKGDKSGEIKLEAYDFADHMKEKAYAFLEGAKCIDEYGGEGQGEDYWKVWSFPKLDILVKFQGWYASYNGSEFTECFEVEAKEVVVTKFFKKK